MVAALINIIAFAAATASGAPGSQPGTSEAAQSAISVACTGGRQPSASTVVAAAGQGSAAGPTLPLSLSELQRLIGRQPVSLSAALDGLLTPQYLSDTEDAAFRRYAATHWYGLWSDEQRDAYSKLYMSAGTFRAAAAYVFSNPTSKYSEHSRQCIIRVPMPSRADALVQVQFREVPFAFPLSLTLDGNTIESFDPALAEALAGLFRNGSFRDRLSGASWPLFLSGCAGNALAEALRRPSREPQEVIGATLGPDSRLSFWAWDFDDALNVRWLMLLRSSSDVDMAALVTGQIKDNQLYVSTQDRSEAETALSRVSRLAFLMSHLTRSDIVRVFPISYYDQGSATTEFSRDAAALRFSMHGDATVAMEGASVIEIRNGSLLAVFLLTRNGDLLFWKYNNAPPPWISIGRTISCDEGGKLQHQRR